MEIFKFVFASILAVAFPMIVGATPIDKYINSNVRIGMEVTSNKFLDSPNLRFNENRESFTLVNAFKNEMAIVDICCGSVGVTPQRISVRSLAKELIMSNYNLTKIRDFSTDTGVRLGMKMDILVKKKGEGYKKYRYGEFTVIEYAVQAEDEVFLRENNMPSYFGKYFFKRGILSRYDFGFDYP